MLTSGALRRVLAGGLLEIALRGRERSFNCLVQALAPEEVVAAAAEPGTSPLPRSPNRPGTSASPVEAAEAAGVAVEVEVAVVRRSYTPSSAGRCLTSTGCAPRG